MTTDKTTLGNEAISLLFDQYDARVREGTDLGVGGYRRAIRQELLELSTVECVEHQRDEFGDVLGNILLLGASLGIRDPLVCLRMTVDKVQRRLDYIAERICGVPGTDDYVAEFRRLWREAKNREIV